MPYLSVMIMTLVPAGRRAAGPPPGSQCAHAVPHAAVNFGHRFFGATQTAAKQCGFTRCGREERRAPQPSR